MYVEPREQELYQYTARQIDKTYRRRNRSPNENTEDENSEDYYLKAGEELDFG